MKSKLGLGVAQKVILVTIIVLFVVFVACLAYVYWPEPIGSGFETTTDYESPQTVQQETCPAVEECEECETCPPVNEPCDVTTYCEERKSSWFSTTWVPDRDEFKEIVLYSDRKVIIEQKAWDTLSSHIESVYDDYNFKESAWCLFGTKTGSVSRVNRVQKMNVEGGSNYVYAVRCPSGSIGYLHTHGGIRNDFFSSADKIHFGEMLTHEADDFVSGVLFMSAETRTQLILGNYVPMARFYFDERDDTHRGITQSLAVIE